MQMKPFWLHLKNALYGAICLLTGWGASTILHEGCHLAAARSFGLPASLGACTFSTGSIYVHSSMTQLETACIAVAGSMGLILIGWLLTKASSQYVRMIGVLFLCRAWVDAIPLCGWDGGLIAGSAGMVIAGSVLLAEVLVCGDLILKTMANRQSQLFKL